MKKIFLAFSFRNEDHELANSVEQVLASQDIRVTTGEHLGGEQLTPAVQARITQADGLIALLTRRDQLAGGGWTTHQWVQQELDYAHNNQKPAIALIEDGISVGGMSAPHEHIPFNRANPLAAFLALVETVGLWKQQAGRTLKVQILPEDLARKVGRGTGNFKCKYRFFVNDESSNWRDAVPVKEPGGTFVYVKGVRDEHTIQILVENQQKKWSSPATSQWMQIQLSPEEED